MSGILAPYRSSRPLRGTPYRAGVRLGALGTSPLVGTVASKGAGLAASALIGSAAGTAAVTSALTAIGAGAAAGSVVPIVGTVIGAVVGLLTSKLFGHANYAQVYADVDNVRKLFQAYAGVAGQYVGRQYGWPEIQQILHGAMVSGLFPGNGPPPGVTCTQAMIANKINACGTGQWVDELIGGSTPGSGTNNIANLIGTGLAQGVVDPITMTDQVLIPGLTQIQSSKYGWAGMAPAQSTNPALYRQWLIDFSDYMMATRNPNMPAYYGTQNVQPLPSGTTAAAVVNSTPTVAPVIAPPAASAAQYSPSMTIYPGDGNALNTIFGVVTFPNLPDSTGNYPITLNGAVVPGATGRTLYWDGSSLLQLTNTNGAVYRWVNAAWVQTLGPVATAPAPAPVQTQYGAVIQPQSIPITQTPSDVMSAGGTVVPVDATAAYISQLQAQGASETQALQAAIAQLQSQGLSAQAAQSTVAAAAPYTPANVAATPLATPVASTGLTVSPTLLAIAGGAALLLIVMQKRGRR